MQEENKQFVARLTTTTLLVLIAVAAWVTLFAIVERRHERFLAQARELEAEQEKRVYARRLEDLLLKTKDDRARLENFFVREEFTKEFFEKIEGSAKHAGIEIAFTKAEARDPHTLEITFNTNGSFSRTFYFISLFEHLPYALSIQTMSLKQSSDEKTKTSFWEGDFTAALSSFVTQTSP